MVTWFSRNLSVKYPYSKVENVTSIRLIPRRCTVDPWANPWMFPVSTNYTLAPGLDSVFAGAVLQRFCAKTTFPFCPDYWYLLWADCFHRMPGLNNIVSGNLINCVLWLHQVLWPLLGCESWNCKGPSFGWCTCNETLEKLSRYMLGCFLWTKLELK